MLSDDDLERALRRHWEFSGKDEDVSHEIYHDDAVLEFPQSGERFEGVENFREWRRLYPANIAFHLRRINHRDDLVVTEYLISYDGAPWMFTVSIMRFRDDRVAHERIYIMDGWEPAEWRKPWLAEQLADPAPPPPPPKVS
jgi:ketosteroid isomerase-like protein